MPKKIAEKEELSTGWRIYNGIRFTLLGLILAFPFFIAWLAFTTRHH